MRHRLTPMVLLLAVALVIPVALGPGVAAAGKKAPVFMGDADGNRLSDDLDTRLASATGGEAVPVIVSLAAPPDDATLAQLAAATGNFQPTARWSHALNAVAARLDRGQIEALTRCQLVNRVDLDREYSACLNKATLWTGVQRIWADWGLDGDRDGNPASYSITDVVISVIDTGIDATHVDLDGGKVLVFYDAVMEGPVPGSADGPTGTLGEVTMPYDDHGHGTHVSSIATGTGEGNPAYRGVAPGAALVGVKVLDSGGFGTSTQIIEGIDWMIANRAAYNIRIGNMSLGSSASSDGTDPVSVAVNNAVANGIIMCVAGGNSGPNTYTTGSPAAATEAITVGALYDPGEKGWALAEFSSRGPTADGRTKPDICAPGRYITAAAKGTGTGYLAMSGTSMATPFVAGVVGLMLDADYALTGAGVKSILYAPGSLKDFGPAGKDIDFGWGVCLPYEDVKQAGGFSGTWTDGLDFSYTTGSVRKGKSVYYDIAVTNDSRPIAITFIIQNYTTAFNFDIYLYDPAGALVASSQTLKRQEQITYQPILPASSAGDGPQAASTYRLKVTSKAGSGDFWFNVSWK